MNKKILLSLAILIVVIPALILNSFFNIHTPLSTVSMIITGLLLAGIHRRGYRPHHKVRRKKL